MEISLIVLHVAGTDTSGNTQNSVNTVFTPQSTMRVLLQQLLRDLGSPDVVALGEGLSTSGEPTTTLNFHSISCELHVFLACTVTQ